MFTPSEITSWFRPLAIVSGVYVAFVVNVPVAVAVLVQLPTAVIL